MAVTPYVVGQWVRDDRFYGRGALIEEILEGNRNCLWLLGTRRIGKTSVLKQLEHVTWQQAPRRYFPLYWDFQGSEEEADLHEGFRDALLDAFDRLDALGIELDAVDHEDLFTSMSRLRRALRGRDLTLLLLGDEVEELVTIYQRSPRFLRRLRRALQSPENIRTVFASTIRLWHLAAEEATTSPFLHGFTPPLPIRGLEDDEARALIRQRQLPAEARPALEDGAVEMIRGRCANHPYLLQILSERYLETGDLERAIEEIAADQMVSFFFGADLSMLSESERRIIQVVDERDGASSEVIGERLAVSSSSLEGGLQRLVHLGFIARRDDGTYVLVNSFFRRWLGELSRDRRDRLPGLSQAPTVRTPPSGDGGRPEPGLPNGQLATGSLPAGLDPAGNGGGGAAPGRIDGRYDLLEKLGVGASGEVYKARDTLLRTVVALKLLGTHHVLDDEALERLRREVVLARDLSHPNILKVYHLGKEGGRRYITMQYVDGPDLSQVIAEQAPLVPARAIELGAKLAGALAALHARDVLHRDVKPSNVLIDARGEPRLTDFGLARLQSSPGVTQKGIFLGTPAYASPEQAIGEDLDERSDLYALGIILFEMVTGRRPFLAPSPNQLLMMQLRTPAPPPVELAPATPPALSDLILRCLAKDRQDRYQTARDLHAVLGSLR